MSRRPIHVFISYAHADREVVERLATHLRWLEHDERIELFDDSKLVGGEKWERRLLEEINKADIVLLVVTADFTASHYCTQVELKAALARCETADICLIPILAAPCDWEAMPITDRQALPKDSKLRLKALSRWGAAREEALTQITKHVRRNVEAIATRRTEAHGQTVSPVDDRNSPKPIPGSWRQPEQPDRCLGRDDDLAVLIAALTAQSLRPIIVFGGAGMGKSTLTREAAAAPAVLARYGDRRAWVELDKATEPAAVVAALVEALGLSAERDPWHGIEAALRQAPALLVLDNLETPWERHPTDVEELLARLARVPGVALVASIRGGAVPSRPAWGTRREVHRLVWPHDRELLLAIATGVPPDDPLLPDVLRALDGWPLAIELFAAQADGLADLTLTWRRWQAERTAMLDRGEAAPDRLSSLAVSLGFSLDSPRLKLKPPHPPDAALRLYAMLGRLPDGLAPADADALLPGSGDTAAHCLVQRRLMFQDGPRFRMLAPVREHAGNFSLYPGDREALHDHYLGLAAELRRYFNGDYRGVDIRRIRDELVNIEALIVQAAAPSDIADRDVAFQRELGSLAIAMGDARREQGQLALAALAHAHAINVFYNLTSCDPANAYWKRDLSMSWDRIGDVHFDQGDLNGATRAYIEARSITDRLVAADPTNDEWQRNLAVSWSKLGDVNLAQDDLSAALVAFTKSKNVHNRLVAADPGNTQSLFDLGLCCERLGDVLVAQSRLGDAALEYQRKHDIIAELAAADPDNAAWQRDLSVSWSKLGEMRAAWGDFAGAVQAFAADMKVTSKLAGIDPDNVLWQRDLIVSYVKLADLADESPEKAEYFREALAVARSLADTGRLAPVDAWMVDDLERRLAEALEATPTP